MNENLKFISIQQFCEKMNLSRSQVYSMLEKGRIKGIKISETERGRWRIPITELKRLHAEAYQNLKGEKSDE